MQIENVNDWVFSHEGVLRLSVFAGLMLAFIALESFQSSPLGRPYGPSKRDGAYLTYGTARYG